MGLIYKTSPTPWGLEARLENIRLVFSATFESKTKRREELKDLFPFFKKTVPVGPNIIDVYNLFSPYAQKAWLQAYTLAKKSGRTTGLEEIFLALLKQPSIVKLFQRLKVSSQAAETLLKNYLKLSPVSSAEAVKKMPFEALALAVKFRNHKIGSLTLLGALMLCAPADSILQAIFTNVGLSLEKLEIFAVWILNLNWQFEADSKNSKLLYCCQQAQSLEQHFGYFFEFPAIEAAVSLSQTQTLKDLQHLKALQLLVKAGLAAKNKGSKIITEQLVLAQSR